MLFNQKFPYIYEKNIQNIYNTTSYLFFKHPHWDSFMNYVSAQGCFSENRWRPLDWQLESKLWGPFQFRSNSYWRTSVSELTHRSSNLFFEVYMIEILPGIRLNLTTDCSIHDFPRLYQLNLRPSLQNESQTCNAKCLSPRLIIFLKGDKST